MKHLETIKFEQLAHRYLDAKDFIIQEGYSWELDWQTERSFAGFTEQEFLKETSWVILSCGFRESTIRKYFNTISESFLNWESADKIHCSLEKCRRDALTIFNNIKKIDSICKVITHVSDRGFLHTKTNIQKEGLNYVQGFPYIGPVTGLHLLKNLGIQIAKPDRHLVRIAKATGFPTAQELCESINEIVGDNIAEIDLVLWRYATLRSDYISHFSTVN